MKNARIIMAAALSLLLIPLAPPVRAGGVAPGARVLTVHQALSLCSIHPGRSVAAAVLGYYDRWPAIGPRGAYKRGDADLFDSSPPPAVPRGKLVGPYWSSHGGLHIQGPMLHNFQSISRAGAAEDWVVASGTLMCSRPPHLLVSSWNPWTVLQRAGDPGVRLSMSLPRRPVPRRALLRITIQARNVSSHPVPVEDCLRPYGNPYVQTIDSKGQMAQQQHFWFIGGPVCGDWTGNERSLPPGATITRSDLTVLWTARLRPVLLLPGRNGQFVGASATLRTVAGKAPSVHLHTGSTPTISLSATEPGERAPVLYREIVDCNPGGVSMEPVGLSATNWRASSPDGSGTYRFRPVCPSVPPKLRLKHWYLIAGWVNHPIVSVTYSSRSSARALAVLR